MIAASLGSLRSRIFLASILLATASIGSAVYFVSALLTAQVETELQRDLTEAVTLVDAQSVTLFEGVSRTARLIADLPKFKAAIETRDPPTIEPIARDYLDQTGADLVVVADPDGHHLAAAVATPLDRTFVPPRDAVPPADRPGATYWPDARGVLQLVTVEVSIDLDRPERLGLLTLGYLLDERRARDLRRLTGADVAFAYGGEVRASSLAAAAVPAVTTWFNATPHARVLRLGDADYSALASPLANDTATATTPAARAHAIVLRSRSERMRTLGTIRAALGGVALVTLALSALLSYGLARTVTRPLGVITAHMREAAATGALTRKVTLPDSAWTDEDAALVASTLNALTDSVAAAQRDAAQRERLSALGRLSTVIAHEIRNPLMIIKGALRQLGRPDNSADAREAAGDIDEEVDRLNRVVNEVLDYARPIRFDCTPTALNDVCRSAVEAVRSAAPTADVSLALDPACGELVTDGERVRTVLVNLLTNARAAVDALGAGVAPRVTLRSARRGDVVRLTVEDNGVGIGPDDLARVFDPYFTTRRTGSGLGLAIAKNIIDGLGGTITVTSQPGDGTTITVDLVDWPEQPTR